jgi:hypothetical protein
MENAVPITFTDLGRNLVWTGNEYVMATNRGNGIAVIRFQGDGTPIDTEAKTILPSGLNGFVTLAAASGQLLLSWSAAHIYSLPLRATDLSRTRDPPLVSRSAERQQSPSITFGSRNFMVAWQEGNQILASRISSDGRSLDGGGIRVSSPSTFPSLPRVAFDGQYFVVAWISYAYRADDGFVQLNARLADSIEVRHHDDAVLHGHAKKRDEADAARHVERLTG